MRGARCAIVLGLVAACTKGASSPPPPPDAAGPRPEGQADLDGDGTADCWHTNAADTVLSVQPSCTGDALEINIVELEIALPKPLATPQWARAIAGLLVGDAHVGCETPTAGCPAGSPALRMFIDERTAPVSDESLLVGRYTPTWLDGAPSVPPPEAIVLDSSAPRRDQTMVQFSGHSTLDGVSMLVWPPNVGAFTEVGVCDAWQLLSGPAGLVAVDRKSKRWSWVEIARPHYPLTLEHGDVQCTGDLLVEWTGYGEDSTHLRVRDLRTGKSLTTGADEDAIDALVQRGRVGTRYGTLTTSMLQGILEAPDADVAAPAGPCPASPVPLVQLPPGPPCTMSGKEDIDGVGAPDCWTATRIGSRTVTIEWDIAVDLGCSGSTSDTFQARLRLPMSWDALSLPASALRWIANRVAGVTGDPPGPAAEWGYATAYQMRVGNSLKKLFWHSGTPTLGGVEFAFGPEIDRSDPPELSLVMWQPVTVDANGTAPTLSSSCERYDVWTSPAGGAIVDRKTHSWAWFHLVGGATFMSSGPLWSAVQRGWCDDKSVYLAVDDGTTLAFDPKNGALR